MKELTQSNPVILSIDGATKTGWAIYKNGKITKHGTIKFSVKHRCADYEDWILDTIEKYNVTHIAAEDIYRDSSHMKDSAFYQLAKLHGVLESATDRYNVELTLLNPLRVKSYMIPTIGYRKHTRAEDKQRMINRVTNHFGYQLKTDKSDDEADAIGIMITYLDQNNIPVQHPKQG